jgi:hypothetical protein
MATKNNNVLTTKEVSERLAARFTGNGWLYLSEMRNATGGLHARTADGLAIATYPSQGCELNGVEIKVSRSDWLHDKNDTMKSNAVGRFCDRWWLAVGDKSIVTLDELPATWGLLVPHGSGLRVARPADKRQPEPIDRWFMAALIRRLFNDSPVREQLNEQFCLGVTEGKRQAEATIKYAERRQGELELAIQTFEAASGIHISTWNTKSIGEEVEAYQKIKELKGLERVVKNINRSIEQWEEKMDEVKRAVGILSKEVEATHGE